jgi:hypothetical protein
VVAKIEVTWSILLGTHGGQHDWSKVALSFTMQQSQQQYGEHKLHCCVFMGTWLRSLIMHGLEGRDGGWSSKMDA